MPDSGIGSDSSIDSEMRTERHQATPAPLIHLCRLLMSGAAVSMALSLSPALLCGCQRDCLTGGSGQDGRPLPDTSAPLVLEAGGEGAGATATAGTSDAGATPAVTRGEAPVTNASIYSMGVFAGYTLDAGFGDDTRSNDYIDNSMYYYVAAEDIWKWNFPTYWPMVGCLSIFAYSPYDPTLRLLDNTGFPSFSYSPLTDVRHQVDFCVAEPELNRTKTAGAIPVYFRHTMAGIMISMNYTGTLPSADYYVKIDRIELGGIIGTKVLAFLPDGDGGSGGHDNPHFRWEDDDEAAKTASYELKRTKDVTETQIIDVELPKKDDGNTNHIQVNPDGGALYLLPQTADKATISITYGYYKANGTSETMMMRFESTAELPSAAWEAGRYTRYRMTLDIGHASILHLVAESGETMIEKYADAKDPATLVDRKVE